MTDTEQYVQLLNYSGCGNTTNANHPVMQRLIMDSLRMWVSFSCNTTLFSCTTTSSSGKDPWH